MKNNIVKGILYLLLAACLTGILVWRINAEPKKHNKIFSAKTTGSSSSSSISFTGKTAPLRETKKYSPEDFNSIDARLSFEDLYLEKYSGTAVEVYIYSSNEKYPASEISGNTLKITSDSKERSVKESRKVMIKVPADMELTGINLGTASGSLHMSYMEQESAGLRSASGSVYVENCSIAGLNAESSSGSIHISYTDAENADVKSNSGSVYLSDGTFSSLEAETISGSLHLEGTADKVSMKTVSGSIYATLSNTPSYDCSFQSTSGSVHLDLPENSAFVCNYETTSGTYHNDITGTKGKRGKETVKGGSTELKVRTTSGSIYVE